MRAIKRIGDRKAFEKRLHRLIQRRTLHMQAHAVKQDIQATSVKKPGMGPR